MNKKQSESININLNKIYIKLNSSIIKLRLIDEELASNGLLFSGYREKRYINNLENDIEIAIKEILEMLYNSQIEFNRSIPSKDLIKLSDKIAKDIANTTNNIFDQYTKHIRSGSGNWDWSPSVTSSIGNIRGKSVSKIKNDINLLVLQNEGKKIPWDKLIPIVLLVSVIGGIIVNLIWEFSPRIWNFLINLISNIFANY